MSESLGNAGFYDARELRRLRETAGLNLDEMARQLGFSMSHLSNVERGVRGASQNLVSGYRSLSAAAPSPSESGPARIPPLTDTVSQVGEAADDFGTRLMRLRLARGWSLALLARSTAVSRTHLGNLETGRRHPSPATAAACDAALNASGALVTLAGLSEKAQAMAPDHPPSDSRMYPETALGDPQALWQVSAERLGELRSLAQKDRPMAVLPELTSRGQILASAAYSAAGTGGTTLWLLAARYAEFAGWVAQEAGFDAVADQWTQAAARWAARGGDIDMVSYQWERRALVTLYQGDSRATIALAQRAAGERGTSSRMAGLARRREAQGHALAGDRVGCERAFDGATDLLARSPLPYPRGASWGPNSISDQGDLIWAACLVDLGACREAAVLFGPDPEVGVPHGALRTRMRFVIRGAMAFAGAGDADYACVLARRSLPAIVRLDSATFRADLRRLIATLHRHPRNVQARQILPDLYNAVRAH